MDEELRIWLIAITALFVIAVVITVIILVKNDKFQKNFAQGKLLIKCNVYRDKETKEKRIEIIVANKTINPVSVISAGLLYNNVRLELEDYIENAQQDQDDLLCKARNHVRIVYSYDEYYAEFTGKKNPKKIQVFTVNNMGDEEYLNARILRKNILFDLKNERRIAKGKPPVDEKKPKEKKNLKEEEQKEEEIPVAEESLNEVPEITEPVEDASYDDGESILDDLDK